MTEKTKRCGFNHFTTCVVPLDQSCLEVIAGSKIYIKGMRVHEHISVVSMEMMTDVMIPNDWT